MPWFKVDDNLGFHHKVIAAGNPAMGLWVRAGSVCAQQLTDGFVPDHMALALGTKAQADRLITVGLWDRVKGGYKFHGWSERQPSKADVEAERAAAADRMRAYRERKRKGSQGTSPQVDEPRSPEQTENFGVGSPLVRDVFGDPDPTRPDPTNKEQGAKRARRIPDDFAPNDTNRRIANERGLDLASVVAQFSDHHRAKGSTYIDWHLALNTWLRRETPGRAPLTVVTDPSQLPPVETSWMRRPRKP